ncbi:MAG: metallophosphoesterase [Planifilum sp.]
MKFVAILWVLAAAVACLLIIARYNTYKANVKRVEIQVAHSLNGNRLNILHLTDLHMEKCSIDPQALLNLVKGERIDLIALTGDYLDTKKMADRFLQYLDTLESLKPRYGMYAVFGNHDYVIADHLPYLKREMEKRNCIVLQNEHRTVTLEEGSELHIIGIDDHYTGRSDVDRAFQGVGERGIRLVLTHDPNIVLEMKGVSFDYLLSGHFHGGQIHWPKPYHLKRMGKLPHLQMIRGLHYHRNRAFYISEGLGQTGFNLRLRSRPEITFHTLCDSLKKSTG